MITICKLAIILIGSWHYGNSQATQYAYPVQSASSDDVYYIKQKTLNELELWSLNRQGGQNKKCLDWRFIPAGFKLLPDGKGFSFIDAGRLRIKEFIKRSPRSVEFNTPLYSISEINWLNSKFCYFSAKQKNHYAIFYADTKTGELACIYQDHDSECLSPKIIGDQIFFIKRNIITRSCSIIIGKTPELNLKPGLDYSFLETDKNINPQVILDCNYQQAIYLNMLNSSLGFYIEHMPYINDKAEIIDFICYKIEFNPDQNKWASTKLFNFNVPKKYLFGDERLYESIMPFLPRAKKSRLYFSDIKQNSAGQYHSSIFEFDLINLKNVEILKSPSDLIFFAPLAVGKDLVYGQILSDLTDQEASLGSVKK
jgi:hypothetical protein